MPKYLWAGLIAILIATVVVYLPILGFEYVNFDDGSFVGPFSAGAPVGPFLTGFQAFDYIPLSWLSFWFESLLFQPLSPGLSHGINLGLHLINVTLLFYILTRFLSPLWYVILAVTAIFALHPMNVESVAWVTERKGLLAAMFLFLSLIFYLKKLSMDERWDRQNIIIMCFSFIFYVLAVLSKPVAIVLPFIFLVFDYVVWRKIGWAKLILEKLVFFLVAVGFGIVHVLARHSDKIIETQEISVNGMFRTLADSVIFYPAQLLVPLDLRVFYSVYSVSLFRILLICALVLLGVLYHLRNFGYKREVVGGLLFYIILIVPQTKIIPYGLPFIHADRYFYLAGVGLILSLVMLSEISKQLKRYGHALRWVLLLPIALACVQTPSQIKSWRNSAVLWERVLQYEPRLLTARNNLGLHWLDFDLEKATLIFEQVIRMDPSYTKAWLNLAHIAERKGNLSKSLEIIENALKYSPNDQALNETAAVLRNALRVQ